MNADSDDKMDLLQIGLFATVLVFFIAIITV
jgi:hypothetical protein